MSNIALLTVAYLETIAHVNTARASINSFPQGIPRHVVINKGHKELSFEGFNIYENTENCLASAWNLGLENIFSYHDYALVIGLDQELSRDFLPSMMSFVRMYPNAGLWSAEPVNTYSQFTSNFIVKRELSTPITHGDGSFSCFIIHKDTFKKVGGFDENFKPAYFEDCDYLERLWKAKYTPLKNQHLRYFHITQGTVKHGEQIAQAYPGFMQKNLDYYKKKHKKVPSHLPQDISFKSVV